MAVYSDKAPTNGIHISTPGLSGVILTIRTGIRKVEQRGAPPSEEAQIVIRPLLSDSKIFTSQQFAPKKVKSNASKGP